MREKFRFLTQACVIYVFLSLLFSTLVFNHNKTEADLFARFENSICTDLQGRTVYWPGHTVSGTEDFRNGTIVVYGGDVSIQAGATLILKDVTLTFNSTSASRHGVKLYGSLNITNTEISATAHSPLGENNILFVAFSNSMLNAINSTISYVGFANSPLSESGVYIESTNSKFESCSIHSNFYGLIIYDSAPRIFNTTVSSNKIGIFCTSSGNALIESNTISGNFDAGVKVSVNSLPLITNNTISANGLGVIVDLSAPEITGNAIIRNTYGGVSVTNSQVGFKIHNNTITNNGGGPSIIFEDNFESGVRGWSATGLWHQTIVGSPYQLYRSPVTSWWYGIETGPRAGTYATSTANYGYLTSPLIDLTGARAAFLSFWYFYETDSITKAGDKRFVELRPAGGNWLTLEQLYGDAMNVWHKKTIDISNWVGTIVQVRFLFSANGIDDLHRGWYIDDFSVATGVQVPTQPVYAHDGIYLHNSNPSIRSNTISKNHRNGIYLDASKPQIANCVLAGNSNGIFGTNGSVPSVQECIFKSNDIGVYGIGSTFDIQNITSEYNNWTLYFAGYASATLLNSAIRYNSVGGCYFDRATSTIINSAIERNFGYGIFAKNKSSISLFNSYVADNLDYGIFSTTNSTLNWYIDYNTYREHATLKGNDALLYGNVTILSGCFSIADATLYFASTGLWNPYITVHNTGILKLWYANVVGYKNRLFLFKVFGSLDAVASTIEHANELYIGGSASSARITQCKILHSNSAGIHSVGSAPYVMHTEIVDSGTAIRLEHSNIILKYSTLKNSSYGIDAYASEQAVIVGNTIKSNGIGVAVYWASSFTIYNSTFSNNLYDFYIRDGSAVRIVNTTYRSAYLDATSQLTINWFMKVQIINETASPVRNANVAVFDRYTNRVFDAVTDTNGFANTEIMQYSVIGGTTVYYTPHRLEISKGSVTRNYTVVFDRNYIARLYTNRIPIITSTPPPSATQGRLYRYQVNVTEPDNDIFSFNISADRTANPITISPTGLIEWLPTNADTGYINISIKVTDCYGAFAKQNYLLEVIDTNEPPVIEPIGFQYATEGVFFSLRVNATDPDGDAIIFSLVQKPAGMKIDGVSGIISWLPSNADVGVWLVIVKATDTRNASSFTAFNIGVNNTNSPPKIEYIPPQKVLQDDTFVYQVVATDDDIIHGDYLTYALLQSPVGMRIDNKTGLIQYLPPNADVGRWAVVAAVTDSFNATALREFELVVLNKPDPPAIVSSPVLQAQVGVRYIYQISATDPDVECGYGDYLEFLLVNHPAGMNIVKINATSAILEWQPTKKGLYLIVVKVVDSTNFSDYQSYDLEVMPGNNLPTVEKVEITPSSPDVTSVLFAKPIGWYDADNDPDGYKYQWQVFSQTWRDIENATSEKLYCFEAGLKRGDKVRVVVTPFDGKAHGAAVISAAIEIQNAKPIVRYAFIQPFNATSTTDLTVVPVDVFDADNDTVTFLYQWYKNSLPVLGAVSNNLAHTNFKKNDLITCELTPYDGFENGKPVFSESIVIANNPPELKGVFITPQKPTFRSTLTANPYGAFDPDVDKEITYFYQWFVYKNGTWLELASAVTKELECSQYGIGKNDRVKVSVTPFDGISMGVKYVSEEVIIANTSPLLYDIHLFPSVGDDTTLFEFRVTYKDDDNDKPIEIQIVIDDKHYTMTEKYGATYTKGVVYAYKTKLSAGTHEYYIRAVDSPESVVLTAVYEIKVVQNIMPMVLLVVLLPTAIIVVLVLCFRYFKPPSKPKIAISEKKIEKKEKVRVEKLAPQIPVPTPPPPLKTVEKPGEKPPVAQPRDEKPLLLEVEKEKEK